MRSTTISQKELRRENTQEHPARWNLSRGFEWHLLTVVLLIVDGLNIGLALRFAYFIRFELSLPFFDPQGLASVDYYQGLVFYIIPTWLFIFIVRGMYRRTLLLGGIQEYNHLFWSTTLAMVVVIAVGFFETGLVFARGWLMIAWLSAFVFTAMGRFIIRRIGYYMRSRGLFLSNAIIVGYNAEAASMAEQLAYARNSGLAIVGIVDNQLPQDEPLPKGLKCLGRLDNLKEIISSNKIEEIILTSSALTREEVLAIFEDHGVSEGTKLRMSSGLYEIITTGLQVREYAWVPLVEINTVRLTGAEKILKAVLDYGLTIPGVLVLSPLLLLISIAIKLGSPGPIIHRRRVLGVNGKEFDAFKFRTMHTNGDEILSRFPEKKDELAKTHKIKDDPRVTRVGQLLRKTSLDELPQLFNVLRNEMSLVGPRMISPIEIGEYTKWGINLLTVKPGITGKWQVSGRSDVTYQERVRLDMYYIRNWNIWLDIQLLLQTIPAVLLRRGAY